MIFCRPLRGLAKFMTFRIDEETEDYGYRIKTIKESQAQ
jgi:hypothetical protein